MDRSLSPYYQRLLKELEQLHFRVVAKLERNKYEDGWEERKKKGNEIRMLVLDAIYNLELRRYSRMGEALEKLKAMGVKLPKTCGSLKSKPNSSGSGLLFEGKGIEPSEDEIVVTSSSKKTNGKVPIEVTHKKTYRKRKKGEATT